MDDNFHDGSTGYWRDVVIDTDLTINCHNFCMDPYVCGHSEQ